MKTAGFHDRFVSIILCLVMSVSLSACGSAASVETECSPGTETAAEIASVQVRPSEGSVAEMEEDTPVNSEVILDESQEKTLEESPKESSEDSEPVPGQGLTAEELIEKINGPEEIGIFEGVEYVRKKNVESYLILGIDNGGTYDISETYRSGGQSDLMMLFVFDKDAKTFTPVQINRDTMAVVDVLDVFGNPISQTVTQITLAYAFGDGSDSSAQNACRAVSKLFGGIDIDGYASINYSAVPVLNDAVGGVTVTMEDDFTSLDPAMSVGQTITLNGSQAVLFCRSRMSIGDGMNTSRMRRQSVYMNAFLNTCKNASKGHSAIINDVYNAAKPYMMSNMNWNTMSNVGSMILSYSNTGIKSPTGTISYSTYEDGNSYAEFSADFGNIDEIVRDMYYNLK